MILYADILFLVNFIMNGFVLWVVSKVLRTKQKKRWIWAGAGLMAFLYTLIIAIPPLRFMNVIFASVVILAAGVALAFHPKSVKAFAMLMAAGYIVSFTVGGIGMALFFLTDLPHAVYFIVSDLDAFSRTISWQIALAGMVLSYFIIKISTKLFERYTLKRQMLCNVCVALGGMDCSFEALVDTGHSLKEPLSQSPVIIAEFEEIKNLLPGCIQILFAEKLENDLSVLLSIREDQFYNRIRMIPFTSLGRKSGMLVGFRPDKVTVEGVESNTDAIIGIYNDKLCRNGRYSGLLSPELVKV
ncbi:MAG: sigma-E processing peptidase SpoIIGA [Defluviitaleaceae bacterium]|nr:sigma-E processing peptidase SpoIIGA [Defluviitaleaceae bacterium]